MVFEKKNVFNDTRRCTFITPRENVKQNIQKTFSVSRFSVTPKEKFKFLGKKLKLYCNRQRFANALIAKQYFAIR